MSQIVTLEKPRTLQFEIFRFNPEEPEVEPRMQIFELAEQPFMTLYIALNRIREEIDPSLQFDFACRSAICGSCGMMVNGRPRLACNTLTKDLPEQIRLRPLPVFKLIGDLSAEPCSRVHGHGNMVPRHGRASGGLDPRERALRPDTTGRTHGCGPRAGDLRGRAMY